MRTVRRLSALGALAALSFACGINLPDPQLTLARSLRPAEVGPVAAPGQTARRTLTARVWADRGHVRGILRWQARLRAQVEAANRVLIATLGTQIEVVSVQTWAYEGGQRGLVPDLTALRAQDEGRGVDVVIGLLSPLASLSPSFSDLGYAELLGKHMVMRGIEDTEEHLRLAELLDERPEQEREALYQSRLRHREVTLLLHELGHLLGAIHVWEADTIMAPAQSHDQGGFAPENLALMGLTLEGRTADDLVPEQTRAALVAYLRATPWQGWRKEAKASLLASLGAASGPREDGAAPAAPAPGAETPVGRAYRLLQAGEVDEAWAALEPELEAKGDTPAVRALACEVAVRKDRTSQAALQWCAKQAEAEAASPRYQVLHGFALQGNGQREAAIEAVRRAEAAIEVQPVADHERLWTMVAQAYQGLDALTWAMRAAGHAEPEAAGRIAENVRTLRKQLGAKGADLGVEPKDEPAYVGAMRRLSDAFVKRQEADVDALGSRLAERFPKVGAPHAQICSWYGQRKRWKKVRKACRAAVERAPEDAQPHFVLGVAAFAQRKPARAVRPLERAIALRPGLREAWSMLLAAYRATGQTAKAVKLARRYQARFGASP